MKANVFPVLSTAQNKNNKFSADDLLILKVDLCSAVAATWSKTDTRRKTIENWGSVSRQDARISEIAETSAGFQQELFLAG